MKVFWILTTVLVMSVDLLAQPHGIEVREPNTELVITELPPDLPGPMEVERVFPRLSFSGSILLLELVDPVDSSKRFFHVSQSGVIRVFPNVPDPALAALSVFLDISARVLDSGEQGLLGLAFDPDFFDNGEFYVYYSRGSPRRSVVSRFRAANPRSGPADAASEEIILEVSQPFSNHNGGMIAFGPDKMLYIALGDGGSGGDPQNHGQDTRNLLGSILRIDVRSAPQPGSGLNYVIPPNNPFFVTGPSSDTRKEIFAYGLRNPYRFSFDKLTDILYVADVGQDAWEEVDIIRSGGNYGWRIMEGDHCFNPSSNCNRTGLIPPIAEYSHASNGGSAAVTGGYVYYGSLVPELYASYIFADFVSGRVFAVRYDGETATPIFTLASTNLALTGFGQDSSGEVYLLDYFGGIYVLRPQTPSVSSSFPTRLSDIPALLAAGSGQGDTVAGVFPYEPSAKLWSDGSTKERYFALPDYGYSGPEYAQTAYRETGGWDFRDDTVIVKNFLLPLDLRNPATSTKRIETRLLYKNRGEWFGFSYEWNDEETDAMLLPSGKERSFTIVDSSGQASSYAWTYPSRSQCRQCHTTAANEILGLNTAQMNHDFLYPASGITDNQLRTFEWLKLFDGPLPGPPGDLPSMPDPADAGASLQDRARAYLSANCSMCHQPGGTAGTGLDLRWEVVNTEMNAIGETPDKGDLDIPDAEIIKAGDPDSSILLARMATLNPDHRMPPLATSRVDEEAVDLFSDWISVLSPSHALTTSISTNQGVYSTGDTLTVGIEVDNPGIASTADLFFGALLPNRDTIVVFTDSSFSTALGSRSDVSTLTAMVLGMDLSSPFTTNEPSFFSFAWSGREPPGVYTMFLAVVEPGAFTDGTVEEGDILALSTVTFTFAP